MQYIDELRKVNPLQLFGWNDKDKRLEACEKLIESQEQSVDLALDALKECKSQICKWQDAMQENPQVSYDQNIENLTLIRDFFELNGRYMLLDLDFLIVFKYLVSASTDWEYRFFARRAYTLMHETRVGFIGKLGGFKKIIQGKVSDNTYKAYMCCLKDFNRFFQQHDEEFVDVRNTNEAHKEEDFETQYNSISNVCVERSFILIQGFQTYLANLFMVMHVVFSGLSKYVNSHVSHQSN